MSNASGFHRNLSFFSGIKWSIRIIFNKTFNFCGHFMLLGKVLRRYFILLAIEILNFLSMPLMYGGQGRESRAIA